MMQGSVQSCKDWCTGGKARQLKSTPRMRQRTPAPQAPHTQPLYGAGADAQGKDLLFYGASIFENWRGTAVGVTWANSAGIVEDYNNTFPNRYNCNVLACSGAAGADRMTQSIPRPSLPWHVQVLWKLRRTRYSGHPRSATLQWVLAKVECAFRASAYLSRPQGFAFHAISSRQYKEAQATLILNMGALLRSVALNPYDPSSTAMHRLLLRLNKGVTHSHWHRLTMCPLQCRRRRGQPALAPAERRAVPAQPAQGRRAGAHWQQ